MIRAFLAPLAALALATAPAAAQTLTVVRNIDAPHYDPIRTTSGATAEVVFLTNDTLVSLDWDLKKPQPLLAKSWAVSPDGKTYTFALRDDVTFCSGKKFTSEDVVYSINRLIDPANKAPYAWRMGAVQEVRAKGPYTVEVELKEPFSELLLNLSNFQATIVNKENVEALGKDFGIKGIDGTGPYCFQAWEPRNHTTLVRHQAYKWGPPIYQNRGPAKYARMVWKIIPEEAARLAAMASGQGDLIYTMPDQYLPQIAKLPMMAIHRPVANLDTFYLGFKSSRENLQDVRVRTALSIAINRKEIVDAIYFGNAEPAAHYINPKTKDFDPSLPGTLGAFDPAKAARLLDEAGWKLGGDGLRYKDGKPLVLQVYGFAGGRSPKIAEVAQGFWRKIGVDAKLQMWDGTIVFSKLAQQDYDIWTISYPYSSAADALRLYFHSKNIPTPNRMNWKDPETDKWLEAALAATDDATRTAALAKVQQIVHGAALWAPIAHQGLALVANKRVKNVRAHRVYGSLIYKTLDFAP